jgi:GAF domain-containing protein/HAMP domain-containing protein
MMRLFETIKNLKLGIKLNILAFLIFSLLLLGMVLTTNNSMNSFILQAGRQTATQDAQTIELRFSEIEQETLNNTQSLSNTPGLSAALIARNIQPIQAEILIGSARLDFDDVDIANAEGRRLFNLTGSVPDDENRLIKLALLGFEATGLVVENEEERVTISIAAATPIRNSSGATIGAVFGSRIIDDDMLSRVNVFSGHSLELGLIVDGRMIASDFENAEDLEYFSTHLLDSTSIGQALNGQTVLVDELVNNPTGSPHSIGHTPLTIGSDTRAVIGFAVNMGDLAAFQGQLVSNQRAVFALFAILGNILLAVFALRDITNPIRRLQLAAEKIANGDYAQRVASRAKDEIGQLTNSFNSMASQLQELVTGLEQGVARRTSELELRSIELEQTTKQNKKRADELQTIAEIVRYISTEKDPESLLTLITKTVSEKFNFYHVGIFLLNNSGKFAVLRAANSTGGQKMLLRQHKLEVGQVGIVGNVTSTGIPRVATNTGADSIYFNNPDLPQTRSELALPLKIQEQVIGALDIQSTDINAFSDEDVKALTTLADQVSIAIQNTRLINQIEKSLAESNAIQRQYIRETWSRMPKEEKISGFRYSATGVVQLDDEAIIAASDNMKDKREISVPIILRGETIGTLSVQVPKSERVGTDQVDLIKAVAERVALSAENARLFEETNRRATREHLVSDITTRIRSTNDPQEMINTAMQELQRALSATRVEMVPKKIAPPPDK